MAEFVNITFNSQLTNRFNNTVSGPAVTNNLGRVVLDASEFFDGDSCGRWDNNLNTFLQIASDSRFNFGDSLSMSLTIKFMLLRNGRYGLIARRQNENNRWHIIVDTSTPDTPKLVFFANDGGTTAHSIDFDFSGVIANLTLGKWHVLEMACDSTTVRFWIDGQYITKSTDAGALVVDAGSAVVEVGRVNQAAVSTPVDYVTFDRYIDSVVFEDTTIHTAESEHYVRTWTGNTERLELFGSAKTQQPQILNQSSFPNNIPDFELASNQLFIAGIEPMRKVDGTSILDVGMDNPGTVNFTGANAGSNFDYVVTWVDARGNESGPSPVSATRGTATNTVNRPATPPAQATHWRVYRRNAGAGQGLHFWVGSNIPIATTSFADTALTESLTIFAPLQGVSKPLPANYIAHNKQRMYYANVKDGSTLYRTRIYYSEINSPEQVGPNSWFYFGDDDSNIITGLVAFRGNLVAFKERSFGPIIGDPVEASFDASIRFRSIGCVAHQTIKEAEGYLLWLDDEGVYAWSGDSKPMLISEDIEKIFNDMPDERKPFASAAVDKELGLYLLSISVEDRTRNDTILCYHFRDSLKDGVHRWTVWKVGDCVLSDGYAGIGRDPRVFFADNRGKLGYFEEGLDLNAGIDFKYKTGRFNPWNMGSNARHHYLTAMVDIVGDGQRYVELGYELNEGGEILETFRDPVSNNLKMRVGARTEYISVVVQGIDIRNRIRFYSFRFDGSPVSRR